MTSKVLKKEIDAWAESDVETALIELKETSENKLDFTIGENEEKFSITYPADYPKSKDRFVIVTDENSLGEWAKQMNEYIKKKLPSLRMADLLTEAAEKYLELTADEDEEQEEEDDDMLGIDNEVKKDPKPKKSKEESAVDDKIDNKEFLEIGSASATMRLIKDLKAICKTNPKEMGFTAEPVVDSKSGLENLYHWHVKLFNFEKGSEISKDMEKYKKQSGQDFILLELRFSKDYPFAPPFVRVVRPRFAFRTGHVTLGGSICMELLTNSGWNSTNDIESILIQIRAELLAGGARLDANMSTNFEYSEHEAWEAFYRAAGTHGWDVKGLSKDMFPKLPS
mmetsp:Transcript_4348/g.6092  ORF Transcript_4348/g.6092 Transcript_4348/m.6092 type:complete len:339 (+) Transcript_4348:66-1082(+)|eukprot:CAMPEP_0168560148 /NCGR_PEP_ID=MMETSP0413-20121227/10904_1 /TAXON_ID=136452 /ORGANISM="Filamoeba nolandi, Strain NC-AS-23-1" /LENGTH=338 /DNA_ID=CAMNT_0008591427 /DNA_START=48 /DNA_END=1064 /DNA_ORIENTATION=-